MRSAPVSIREITVVLDTGMHRVLAYSADSCEDCCQVMRIQVNYQRQVTCQAQLEQVRKLRLEVLGTNGLDHARIFEIRCY
jgi:hypothetical protein